MFLAKKLGGEKMKNEKLLEFNLIKETLINYASMKLNKNKINNLKLIKNKDSLQNELIKTDEASKILLRYGRIIIEELNNKNFEWNYKYQSENIEDIRDYLESILYLRIHLNQ